MASQDKSDVVRLSGPYALDKSGMVRWSVSCGLPEGPWSDIIAGLLGACPEAVHAERYR